MIIAITGVKRSGKDTAAKYLTEKWQLANPNGLPFKVYHFADPLKRAMEVIYGWDRSVWDSDEKEAIDPYWGISPRQAAQCLGTEWSILLSTRFPNYELQTGRKTYLKAFQRYVETHKQYNFILPDMRFNYEAEAIRDMGGMTLRIRRPEVETTIDAHASEQEILSLYADTEIVNDGTLGEFYEVLDFYAKAIKLEPASPRNLIT